MYKIPHSKPCAGKEEVWAASFQIGSGMHASGEKRDEFEGKMREIVGPLYAKATNSGTSALHLALMGLEISDRDEVIIPSYVCSSVMNAVDYIGARAVLADIDKDFNEKGYNISARTIKDLINKRTKAIIVPHMFGTPADLESILDLGISVIEDCAQSLGAKYKGKITGGITEVGVFSFCATKVISTGHGGMIVSSSNLIKENLEDLTKYDKRENYSVTYNYELSNIQAAIGIEQLKKLDYFIERRKIIAEKYDGAFSGKSFKIPSKIGGSFPFRYVIKFSNEGERDNMKDKLIEKGIRTELPVFKPLHRYMGLDRNKFLATEEAYSTTLSIPIYPALKEEEVDYIIKSVLEVVE